MVGCGTGPPNGSGAALTEVPLLVAFGAGIISLHLRAFLPAPRLPSLMSGYSIAELETGAAATGRMLRATGLFVAGFTAVFVALGAGATAIGSALRG